MMYAAVFLVFCALLPASMSQRLTDLFPPGGMCGLSTQDRVDTLRGIKFAADCSSNGFQPTLVPECGDGVWCRIVDFAVTGADTMCPDGWTFATTPVGLGCTRPDDDDCALATFPTGSLEFKRVCGRVTGAASGTPDGFEAQDGRVVNGVPLAEGVTLTLRTPFAHIWTFAAVDDGTNGIACPFNEDNFGGDFDEDTLTFVQDNHFCDIESVESGAKRRRRVALPTQRRLWTGVCDDLPNDSNALEACNFNDPPYFNVTLANPTTDDIDARICLSDDAGEEQVFVESMVLFVQ